MEFGSTEKLDGARGFHASKANTATSTFPVEGRAKSREREKTSSEADLPKTIVAILSFLLNLITQPIGKEILSVNHQELRLLHADHRGPPDGRAQEAHFLGKARTRARVTPHSAPRHLPCLCPPLEVPLGPLQTPIRPPPFICMWERDNRSKQARAEGVERPLWSLQHPSIYEGQKGKGGWGDERSSAH